jgi:anti-sigma B factor antagonist
LRRSRFLTDTGLAAVTGDKDTYPVRWAGSQAVVTLPEHIDLSNAGQIREQLLSVINRGATVLIADMTATLSCDHAGADTVVRAYQRAVISGTQLRLVITGEIVRRVLTVNGLDRLIPIYLSLDAALAERQDVQGTPGTGAITPAVPGAVGQPRAADQAAPADELLHWVVTSIFDIALLLQTAADLPRDAAGPRITEALGRIDDVVREVRDHRFARRVQAAQSSLAQGSALDTQQRLTQAADRAASLQERVAQTARALQSAAADTAALLQQQAALAGQPARIDYPAEIKRWQAFADQAEQMAKHWEQRP